MGNRRSKKQISKTTPKDRAIAARFKQTFEVLKDRSNEELLEIIKTNIIPNYPKKNAFVSALADKECIDFVDMRMSHTDQTALAYLQEERKRADLQKIITQKVR